MMKAKVLRCITNGAPVFRFDSDRRLTDGQLDLGPTFNAMRKSQQDRRRQENAWRHSQSNAANVANQLGAMQINGSVAQKFW